MFKTFVYVKNFEVGQVVELPVVPFPGLTLEWNEPNFPEDGESIQLDVEQVIYNVQEKTWLVWCDCDDCELFNLPDDKAAWRARGFVPFLELEEKEKLRAAGSPAAK